MNPKKLTLRHIITKMAEVKDNESILTVAIKKKELLWNPHKAINCFSLQKPCRPEGSGKIYSKS